MENIFYILEESKDETTLFVVFEFLNKIINSDLVHDYLSIRPGRLFYLDKPLRCVDLFNNLSLEDDPLN